jgi:hypothetical protein
MAEHRYSRLAIASVVLNLPHIALLADWLFELLDPAIKERGIKAVAIFFMWIMSGPLAIILGIVAMVNIGSSPNVLRGRWLAILGTALAMVVPALGLASCMVIGRC